MKKYSIFTCKKQNSAIKTNNSYISKDVGFFDKKGMLIGNNINGNVYKSDKKTYIEILSIWEQIKNRDIKKDEEFYLNEFEDIGHYDIITYESYISFFSKEKAKKELKEIFTNSDSKILNFNVYRDSKLKIIVNFDLLLENNDQGTINLMGNTYENVYWIIYGEAIFIDTNVTGIIIASNDIIVKNSKITGKLISIYGDILLDLNSTVF